MTVLKMRIVPDPILRQKAKKMGKIPANMKKLVSNMVETMHGEHGVGLAANQIGSLQKVAVIQTPEMEEPLVLINPEIVKQEGEREIEEGCLSIPGYRGLVKRSVSVRARALGLDGKVIRIKADELLAQALEHEIDHLNGILYIDRLVSPGDLWKIEPVGEHDDGDDDEEEQEFGEDDGVESEDSSGLENAVAVAQDGGNAAG
ncbi:MAG TPA: peptide deformylase [Dehalococcoidia bacterium]|nr:peptide deformylase [Dehalococcoidia bacterium]